MMRRVKETIDALMGTTPVDVLKNALLVVEFDYLDAPTPELNKQRTALFDAIVKAESHLEKIEILESGFPAVRRTKLTKALVQLKVQGILTDDDIQGVLN